MRSVVLLITLVLALVFSLLNTGTVTLHFLVGNYETRIAVAVIGALMVGLLSGALLVLPWGWRERRACRRAVARVDELEKQLAAPEQRQDSLIADE